MAGSQSRSSSERCVPAASHNLHSFDSLKPQIAVLTAGRDKPYALGLADALLEAGLGLDFIGSDEVSSPSLKSDPRVRFLNLRGDQRIDVPALQKVCRVLNYYRKLIWYAARAKPRLFHILWNNKFEIFDRTVLMAYYKLLGKRIAFTAHNVNAGNRDDSDTWLNRVTLRVQYHLSDHIFVHTERMKSELREGFGIPGDRVTVIPFGINNTIPVTDLTVEAAKQSLGLASNEKALLFFGNIAPYKGLEYLVGAFSELAKTDESYRLIVVGRPKGEPGYWSGIAQTLNGLGKRVVQRIEYVPDAETERYFKAADVLILPYTHIFQSGVLFLGYSFGLPVIATDVGSLREEIVEGRTGLVCRPRDPVDLARAIREYFATPMYRELVTRRQSIREFANDRYSWNKVARITAGVYSRLLPSNPAAVQNQTSQAL